jgi:hypothetical protein
MNEMNKEQLETYQRILPIVKKAVLRGQGLPEACQSVTEYVRREAIEFSDEQLGPLWSTVRWIYAEQLYLVAGKKDYELSLGLAERLLNTTTKGIAQTDVKLPFECFKLIIPIGFNHSLSSRLNLSWVYVFRITFNQGAQHSIQFVTYLGSGNFASASVPLEHGKDISEMWRNDSHSELSKFFAWIVNVILYATSSDARSKQITTNQEYQDLTRRLEKATGAKREKLKERRRSLEPGYRIYLGADVPPLGNAREGSSPTVRTLVQGHWRNQVCGPQWQERKLIWIQPFWRGPEFAEITNPIRVLRQGAP